MYSVWLVPTEPYRALLQRQIDTLAAAHSLPPFVVHLTLVPQYTGSLATLTALCSTLSSSAPPFSLALHSTVAGEDAAHWRFRCVYVKLRYAAGGQGEEGEGGGEGALRALRAAAESSLGFQEAVYMPHLSLAYSDCDAATRAAWAAEARGSLAETATSLGLVCFDRLQVWETSSSDPASWALVSEFMLGSGAAGV
jgi:hypothetical protein